MRLLGTLLAALLLGGCAARGTSTPPLRDFRGIVHCHSLYSHDSKGTYAEILAAAKAAGVDFICMTDHPPKGDAGLSLREGWKGLHDGVLFIQGHELAGTHLLALGIEAPVRGASIEEKIADIRRQGGVSIVSHPEEVEDWTPYLGADGMEIFNVHAAFTKLRKDPAKLGAALRAVKEEPERSFRHLQELDPALLARWDEINRTRPFAGVAANDAHQNTNILGLQLDPYPRVFRFVATHVRAEALTQEAVLRALKEGRGYLRFGPSDVPFDAEAALRGRVPERTRIYREGREVGPPIEEPGLYRVVQVDDEGLPRLVSNPIRVR